MPFTIPSLKDLIARIGADIEDRLEGADAGIRNTPEGVLARVLAAASRGLHKHLQELAKQITPLFANEVFLAVHAEVWGVPRNAATKATGVVSGTGVATTQLPAGTELTAADGTLFVTDNLETVDGGGNLLSVEITAKEAGAAGNLATDTILTLTTPVPNIDAEFTVLAPGTSNGADLEDVEAWRVRILDRMADPPTGGGPGDYVQWAKEVSGVTRAWEQPDALGPGTVRVLFARDDDGTGSAIVPSAGEVTTVQEYLQEKDGNGKIIGGKAPITANVTVVQPTGVALSVSAQVKLDADSGLTQAQAEANIEAELVDMLKEFFEPGGTIRLSQIREAISRAVGESYHNLTSPVADIVYQDTDLAYIDAANVTITWL